MQPTDNYSLSFLPTRSLFNNISGIYGIYCVPSNKWYIGQAKNIYTRLLSHKNNLKRGKKVNQHFYRAYSKYGADSFEIFILEVCDIPSLNIKEKYYMDKYNSINPAFGYNDCYFDENMKPSFREDFRERVKNKTTKLRFGDATVIRELYKEGYAPTFIATHYKINKAHLSKILGNGCWKDSTYTKPTKVPDLNIEQRNTVEKYISDGKSGNEIIKLTGIYWKRIHCYLQHTNRNKRIKHNTLILDKESGIYYFSVSEAARAKDISHHLISDWLVKHPTRHKNQTSLQLC